VRFGRYFLRRTLLGLTVSVVVVLGERFTAAFLTNLPVLADRWIFLAIGITPFWLAMWGPPRLLRSPDGTHACERGLSSEFAAF
jgi:hypothetical protein